MEKVPIQEVHEIGFALAGYYAALCENEYGDKANFEPFGADAIKHLYEYREIVKNIPIPYLDDEITIDTENYRASIYRAIFNKYGNG